MAIIQVQKDVAKEVDEVLALMVGLVKDVKAKKPLAEIAAGQLVPLMSALEGIDKLDDEIKENRAAVMATVGAKMGDLLDAILPK